MTRAFQIVAKTKKRLTLFGAVVVMGVSAVVAIAYFTSRGAGAGTASVATAQSVTISAGTAGTQLFPGGSADVALSISNPNAFAVRISSLQLDASQGVAGFGVDGGHTGCNLGSLGFTTQTNSGSGWTVPANGSIGLDLVNAVSMNATAVNACQNATFRVYLKAGP
jgi:hypothetical protein